MLKSTKKIVTPEDIVPYPKAGPWKRQRRGGRKTLVLTYTPVKAKIEEEQKLKETKKDEKAAKAQLFNLKKRTSLKKQKFNQETILETSEEESFHSDSSSEFELEPLSDHEDLLRPIVVGDWIIVTFSQKKSIRRFVGCIREKIGCDGWKVKFAKHIDGSKFKWPEKEDVSVIDDSQVEKQLVLPIFK